MVKYLRFALCHLNRPADCKHQVSMPFDTMGQEVERLTSCIYGDFCQYRESAIFKMEEKHD